MLLAQVISPIVYRRAVSSRRLHQVQHHSGDIDLVSSREGLLLSCLVVCISTDSTGVLILLLLKEGGDSVLSFELLPCFFRQVVDYLASESDAGHGVKNDFVRDHIAYTQHFAVKACFNSVYVLSLPQACCNHRGAKINEH